MATKSRKTIGLVVDNSKPKTLYPKPKPLDVYGDQTEKNDGTFGRLWRQNQEKPLVSLLITQNPKTLDNKPKPLDVYGDQTKKNYGSDCG